MRGFKVLGSIVLFFVILYSFRNFFTVGMLTGKYANTNYENSMIAEVPDRADTLILYDDMTYKSSYYGEGTFSLEYSFEGTHIDWSRGSNGVAGRNSQMQRNWYGNIQISLVTDLRQHYSKFN